MKNVSNCLLVILKVVIIQKLPHQYFIWCCIGHFKNNSLFEASYTGTSERERIRCTGSALQIQQSGTCTEHVLLAFSEQHRVTTEHLHCIW